MMENVGKQIAALQRMSVSQLRERYAEVFGEATTTLLATGLIRLGSTLRSTTSPPPASPEKPAESSPRKRPPRRCPAFDPVFRSGRAWSRILFFAVRLNGQSWSMSGSSFVKGSSFCV
jgi:hypothetical protein